MHLGIRPYLYALIPKENYEEDVHMIHLFISSYKEFRLEFNTTKTERFSECKLQFINEEVIENLCEDYLYVFIDEMLGRLRNIPILSNRNMLGKMGEWQEYYYFESDYNEQHYKEINIMKKAIFISTEGYGLFLYQCDGKIWLEIDKGFSELDKFNPLDYYSDPDNYRVLLSNIPAEVIKEWMEQLEAIEKVIS